MDTRSQNLETLILRGRDYGEADRILVLFSRENGKFSAIAKGVRKPKSHLKAATQLFMHSRLTVSGGRGSGLRVISQGEAIDGFLPLRTDLDRIACAAYVGEMIDLALPERRPNEDIFLLALTTLTLLAASEQFRLILRWFELRLLAILGYRPQLDSCAACGGPLRTEDLAFSPGRGGLLCTACAAEDGIPISGAAAAVMDKLLRWDILDLFRLKLGREQEQELERVLYAYLDRYIERSAKARDGLRQYLDAE